MAHTYSEELDDSVFLLLSEEQKARVLEAERKKREAEKEKETKDNDSQDNDYYRWG